MPGKFAVAFADDGPRRFSTPSERELGFPCGDADVALWNGMFHTIQAEFGDLIDSAGLTDDPSDHQQLRKAIEALIQAGIESIDWGEGEGPDLTFFLLLNQARQRLPFFPEVVSSDNRINVTQPVGGTVLVPPTVSIMHRGIHLLNTSDFTELQRTFSTAASRTYHLRLRLSPGQEALRLESITDTVNYNPTSTQETSPIFDSNYDDMLIARIVTNGSNVASITNLRNADRLVAEGEENGPGAAFSSSGSPINYGMENNIPPSGIVNFKTVPLDWGRSPQVTIAALNDVNFGTPFPALFPANNSGGGYEQSYGVRTLSRYALAAWAHGDPDIKVAWVADA